jgi:hypothetical protein
MSGTLEQTSVPSASASSPAEIDADPLRVRRFSQRLRMAYVVADAIAALVVLLGVFVGLPTRWAVVDVPAAILIVLLAASCVALVRQPAKMALIVRNVAFVQLALGLLLFALGAWTAAYLNGVYGPVGRGGALILVLVIAIALPYLIVLPATKLLWIGPSARATDGDAKSS